MFSFDICKGFSCFELSTVYSHVSWLVVFFIFTAYNDALLCYTPDANCWPTTQLEPGGRNVSQGFTHKNIHLKPYKCSKTPLMVQNPTGSYFIITNGTDRTATKMKPFFNQKKHPSELWNRVKLARFPFNLLNTKYAQNKYRKLLLLFVTFGANYYLEVRRQRAYSWSLASESDRWRENIGERQSS